jgi:SAM-dependent methyltransferase
MKGDTMHIASEPFKPRPELVRLVESCLERIRPDPPHLTEWFRSYAMNHKTRIAFDINIVRENLPQNTRVLEFGSVPLLFTAALAECGYQLVGIDITPERFQSSIEKLGLTVLRCDIELEKLPIQDNTYDAIVFNELFEHLRINPIFTMSEAFRVVKPNGLLFLSSPNLRSLGGSLTFYFAIAHIPVAEIYMLNTKSWRNWDRWVMSESIRLLRLQDFLRESALW